MKTRRCPDCGSERIGRTVYGMPDPSKLDDDAFIVGCVIDGELLDWGCHDCEALFDLRRRDRSAAVTE